MNVAAKLIIFIMLVFLIGGIWQVMNISIDSYNEAMANQTQIDPNPYPNVTNLYNYLWLAVPLVIGMIGTALYLINWKDRYGGYIQ